MNTENIKQIVEGIKTLNINFNDATTQKIAEAILPVIKLYFVKEVVIQAMWGIITLIVIMLSYKLFVKMVDTDREKVLKKLENEKIIEN